MLNKFIQYEYSKLTNQFISLKDVKKYYLPLIEFIENSKGKKILLSGSQGIGKTTFIQLLKKTFKTKFKKNIITISLDDFYLDKDQRIYLSNNVHPLLKTRGVPGTHDVYSLNRVIDDLNKEKFPINLPIFDKLKDRRVKKIKKIISKSDYIILEGWCLGCPPITKEYLFKNINNLEKLYDKKNIWRNYYNNQLKFNYKKLFNKFDSTIFFKSSSFKNVNKWRIKQENFLKKRSLNKSLGMSDHQIEIFIQHYEKITKWMINNMHKKSNLIIEVNRDQKITKINYIDK